MKSITFKLALLLFLFTGNFSHASHIIGGEVYYDYLGNNQYKITIEIYRDCNSNMGYDSPLKYTVFNGNGTLFSEFTIPQFIITTTPVVYSNPCNPGAGETCIERALYKDTVLLPQNSDGYTIAYQRCCWAGNIDNLFDPTNNGITLSAFIPGSLTSAVPNNAARFDNNPPKILCTNQVTEFDHHATDSDNDQLIYSLVNPLLGGSTSNVEPNPETAPPFTPVTWMPTFSASIPLGAASSTSIDSINGVISFSPYMIGNYLVGVQVDELRNGQMIASKIQTYCYKVIGCQAQAALTISVIGNDTITENCDSTIITLQRPTASFEQVITFAISGSATVTDFEPIASQITLPVGVFSHTLNIKGVYDGLVEGHEQLVVSCFVFNPCQFTTDSLGATVTLVDYTPLTLTTPATISLCGENPNGQEITCNVQNGQAPYFFDWQFSNGMHDSVITIDAGQLVNFPDGFQVTVTDQCQQTVVSDLIVFEEKCPLIIPNVLTVNNDGRNDVFVLQNAGGYHQISLQITNRWGNVIYENADYQNNWNGLDISDKPLTEGAYFYLIKATTGNETTTFSGFLTVLLP
ncbi:MAG: gliding motility-associated C-terminal domain-containing protein [Moraxellaceae bacterium]